MLLCGMKFSFAIIGCGRIAEKHAEQISRIGNLVAVCDANLEKAEKFASAFDIPFYDSLITLLQKEKDVDIVSICTPNGLHAAQTITSLAAGKHVLCEKPLCTKVSDALEMILAAKTSGKKLFIVKSTRYNPVVLAIKSLINDGKLGKIYSFQLNCIWNRPGSYYANSWKGSKDMDGGTLFTQFSHYIDVMLWFFGETASIEGFRSNLAHEACVEFEDSGCIALEMKSGALGTVHYSVNAINKNQEVSLCIVGEKGSIKLGGEYMNELIYQEPFLIDPLALANEKSGQDAVKSKSSLSNHDKVYENVVKSLSGEKSAITDGEDALKTVVFIEEFYKKTKVKQQHS